MIRTPTTLQVFSDEVRLRAALAEDPGAADGLCTTWESWLSQLGGARVLGRKACSALAAEALLARLAGELDPGPWGAFVREPAFARAARNTLQEVKAAAFTPRTLQDAADALPPEQRVRVRSLAQLFHLYEQQLESLGWADWEDQLAGARRALEAGAWAEAWRGVGRIVIHGLHDVKASGVELLLALARACERREVNLCLLTPLGGSVRGDAALSPLFRAFEAQAERLPHVDLEKEDVTFEGRPLGELARALFTEGEDLVEVSSDALRVWCAPTPRAEVLHLGRDIRWLIQQGCAPERIAVAWRDMDGEALVLAEALAEVGVAADLPWGERLAQAGPVRLALMLPQLVEDDFPVEQVAALVSSRFAPVLSRGLPESVPSVLAQAGIRDDRFGATGRRGAYDVRLDWLARRLGHREALEGHGIRLVRERCLRLISVARELPEQGTAAELLAAWWRGVEGLGLADSEVEGLGLADSEVEGLGLGLDDILAEGVMRAQAREAAARDALRVRVRELEAALGGSGGGPYLDRRGFARYLAEAFRDVRLPAPPRVPGAVQVVELGTLAGRAFDHLFLAGLTEGRLPRAPRSDVLLPEGDRIELNRCVGREAFRLTGGDFDERVAWSLAEDRLHFSSALAAVRRSVSLSFAAASESGAEAVASAFIEEVRRRTGLEARLRPSTPIPALDDVFTESELRERVMLETLVPERLRVSRADPAAARLSSRFAQEPWLVEAKGLVEMETERLRFFGDPQRLPDAFTGEVGADVVERLFTFNASRPLSASALSAFGNCAFQGLLAYGLRLPSPETAGEELDARGRGTFWHKVLEELFRRLGAAGGPASSPEQVPDALVDESLAAAAKVLEARSHVGHPALWELAQERARGMARRILAVEREALGREGARPREFELKFGPGAVAAAWQNVVLEGELPIHFEGKIDRVDEVDGGVAVIDYKSGRLGSRAQLRAQLLVTDFQLPLYLYAARAAGHTGAARAAWLSLRTGERISLREVLTAAELEELLSKEPAVRARVRAQGGLNLPNAVEDLVKRLRAGRFAPRPQECGECGYRPVCRISQRRLAEDGA